MAGSIRISRGWLEAAASCVPLLVLAAGGGIERAREHASRYWREGHRAAIAVKDGKAAFRVPVDRPESEILLVVSALALERGPHPISVAVKEADAGSAPLLEDDGPVYPSEPATIKPFARNHPTAAPAPRRAFSLLAHDGDPSDPINYRTIDAELRGVGRDVQVYVAANDLDAVSPEQIRDAITVFDDQIEPAARRLFGSARDVDGDGRFTILFSNTLARVPRGHGAVDGFTRPTDFDSSFVPPLSNRCDMIYLRPNVKGTYLHTLIAHEYMHAILAGIHASAASGSGRRDEEGWLDEALAHLAEDDQHASLRNIDYRVNAYLEHPETFGVRVEDYFSAGLFRSAGDRGAAYLFVRWCVDRYGVEARKLLVLGGRTGIANLESATGATFASLFRRWSIALWLEGRDARKLAEAAASPGGYGIDAWGPLDDFDLMGPRTTHLSAARAEAERWDAAGTSPHYILIDGARRGAIEVHVTGPPAAKLQVTAIPLGAAGRLELELEPLPASGGKPRFQAKVRERHGREVRLQAMTWMPAGSPVYRRDLTRQGRLDMLGIAARFGSSLVPASGAILSKPIPLERDEPITVRVIGIDSGGKRVAAWADLKPRPDETAANANP